MISDLFSPKARAFPISIFFASGMMGAGGSFIVGGAVVAAMTALVASGILPSWAQPWRLTFIAVGIPGLLIALLILVRVREPARTEVALNSERPGDTELIELVPGKGWGDRKSDESGKSGYVRVEHAGRRSSKKKERKNTKEIRYVYSTTTQPNT